MAEPATVPVVDDPAILADLTPAERAEAEALLENLYGGEHPAAFIARCWPSEEPGPHHRVICDVFARARRERVRVCISMPPRHGKTVTILRCLIQWLIDNPRDLCAYTTYNDTRAAEESNNARAYARDVGLHTVGNSKLWRTEARGGFKAAGVEGGLTGKGVTGVLVVDDPYKDREDADSFAYRRKVKNWFQQVAFTRLERASVIVVHTRWHHDDLISTLEAQGWEVINLPAIAENDNDLIGRRVGEALWPARFPLVGDGEDSLTEILAQIGEWAFASLYQGHPRKQGAEVFKEPGYYDLEKTDLTGCMIFIGADPAASEKEKADHSAAVAIAVRGYGSNRVAYILDEIHGQWTVPEFTRRLRAFQQKWGGAHAAIEASGVGKAVPQILRDIDDQLRISEVHPSLSKFIRAQPVASAWNGEIVEVANDNIVVRQGPKRVLLPIGKPWVAAYVSELKAFTGQDGDTDDRADALSHAWNVGLELGTPVQRGAKQAADRWR